MKHNLRSWQQGAVALLLTGWLTAGPEHAQAQAPVRSMTVLNDEKGQPERIAHEIIVRFQPNDVHINPIDDISIQDGILTDFVKAGAVEFISGKVGTWLGEVPTYKIYTRMTSADTLSIDRLGETVPVEKLWSSFVLLLPANLNEKIVCESLNDAFPTVLYAHPNWVGQVDKIPVNPALPNDPFYAQQANLRPTTQYPNAHINVGQAWKVTTGSNSIKVGVFDSGINAAHPDLNNGSTFGPVVTGGYDFVNNRSRLQIVDLNGHGTACAGIIGARRNSADGIAGIAGGEWANGQDGIRIFDMKMLTDAGGITSISTAANAIVEGSVRAAPSSGYGYALDIMSSSWGGYLRGTEPLGAGTFSSTQIGALKDAVRTAHRNKVVFVASRGNNYVSTLTYPACFADDWVLNIGASGKDGQRKVPGNGDPANPVDNDYGTNWAGGVDLIAPGTTAVVYTTHSPGSRVSNLLAGGGQYGPFNGTSAAAPHAAGVAALLLSAHNSPTSPSVNLAPEDVEHLIERQATDITGSFATAGYDEYTGWGRLNAGAAVYKSRPGPYRVVHQKSTALSYVLQQFNATVVLAEGYGAAGLAPGIYVADVYRATANMAPSALLTANENVVDAWARNSSSTLW